LSTTQDIQGLVTLSVVELCFDDPAAAPEAAAHIVRAHPDTVYRVVSDSNVKGGTSVLHLHIPTDKVDDVVGNKAFIKGNGGTMLVTTPSTN